MKKIKEHMVNNICYTDLVYGRINKKLNSKYSNPEIEKLIRRLIIDTKIEDIKKMGKNYYLYNYKENVKLTVNSYTTRIITVDKI